MPFLLDAATFAASSGLVAGVRGQFRAARPRPGGPAGLRSFRSEVAEGLGWLWRHRLPRGMCLMHTTWNLVDTAVYGVLVLYAQEVLALDARGYGLLVATGAALGGLLASVQGLRAPFWLEAAAMLLTALAGLRLLTNSRILAARSA